MGGAKTLWMEQMERGYGSSNHFVCHNCVGEIDLKNYILQARQDIPCTYCGYPEAASVEDLTSRILNCLASEWEPYDSSRDGAIKSFSFREVICYEQPIDTEQEALIDEMERIVAIDFWNSTWNYDPDEDEKQEAWHRFKFFVTHQLRFTSFLPEAEEIYRNSNYTTLPADSGMKYILDVIDKYELRNELDANISIYRIRLSSDLDNYGTATAMGTVPKCKAIVANRMSPVGIPMFYGAFSCDVALREVKRNPEDKFQHVAVFKPSRNLFVADFTELPPMPSIFSEARSLRPTVSFLKRFAEEISKPLKEDGLDHLEYLPSQIVTEYLRVMCRHQGSLIDGIRYKSAQGDGNCIVLFVDNDHCYDHQPYPDEENHPTFSEQIGIKNEYVRRRPRLYLILDRYSMSALES